MWPWRPWSTTWGFPLLTPNISRRRISLLSLPPMRAVCSLSASPYWRPVELISWIAPCRSVWNSSWDGDFKRHPCYTTWYCPWLWSANTSFNRHMSGTPGLDFYLPTTVWRFVHLATCLRMLSSTSWQTRLRPSSAWNSDSGTIEFRKLRVVIGCKRFKGMVSITKWIKIQSISTFQILSAQAITIRSFMPTWRSRSRVRKRDDSSRTWRELATASNAFKISTSSLACGTRQWHDQEKASLSPVPKASRLKAPCHWERKKRYNEKVSQLPSWVLILSSFSWKGEVFMCFPMRLYLSLSLFLFFSLSLFLSFSVSLFLSFSLSLFLSFSLSLFLSFSLSLFLSFSLSLFLSFLLSFFPSFFPSFLLSLLLSFSLLSSLFSLFSSLAFSLSLSLPLSPSLSLPPSLSNSLPLCRCLSTSLPLFFCLSVYLCISLLCYSRFCTQQCLPCSFDAIRCFLRQFTRWSSEIPSTRASWKLGTLLDEANHCNCLCGSFLHTVTHVSSTSP